jgi:hypothetical protein
MNYELAKQLKDAGFPFKDITCDICKELGMSCGALYPTLSELIEACMPARFSLWCYPHGFVIGFPSSEMRDDMEIQPSPEIAVAKLWLALNQSK